MKPSPIWLLALGIQSGLSYAGASEAPQPVARPATPPSVARGVSLVPATTPTLSFSGWLAPQGNSSPTDQLRLNLQLPLMEEGSDRLALLANLSDLHLGAPGVLTGSGKVLPHDFWKIESGLHWLRMLDGGRSLGTRFTLGSSSETPFAAMNVTSFSVAVDYSYPTSDVSRWVFYVLLSNSGPFTSYIPIPGFSYVYTVPDFSMTLGFPVLSIRWKPSESITTLFSFFGPNFSSEVSHGEGARGGLQEYLAFSWGAQAFLQKDRATDREHLYFAEKRAVGGLRFPLSGSLGADLSAGYSFDRAAFAQEHYFFKVTRDRSDLAASWVMDWNLRIRL